MRSYRFRVYLNQNFKGVYIKRGTLSKEFLNAVAFKKPFGLWKAEFAHEMKLLNPSKVASRGLFFLKGFLVRNRKFLSAFFPARCQYPATIGRGHSFTETVFILTFSFRWLECTFHQ